MRALAGELLVERDVPPQYAIDQVGRDAAGSETWNFRLGRCARARHEPIMACNCDAVAGHFAKTRIFCGFPPECLIALARIGGTALLGIVFLHPRVTSLPVHGGAFVVAAAIFAAGFVVGATVMAGRASAPAESEAARTPAAPSLGAGYPVTVIRVNDGDTFEARVRIWPGTDVTTKVRLRTVDTPEMSYRCDEERVKAYAAREALTAMLRQGSVTITNVQQDKYGGRVDADVATAGTPSVADALIARGLARPYEGGRKADWCG
jgi:endonuclease YncB( thermonuclease family)